MKYVPERHKETESDELSVSLGINNSIMRHGGGNKNGACRSRLGPVKATPAVKLCQNQHITEAGWCQIRFRQKKNLAASSEVFVASLIEMNLRGIFEPKSQIKSKKHTSSTDF
ncbi:MAG: hypothetical protein E7326_08755 [Clostridiales bacterium]|nr:hypothetical protein [Clostridiales bacterium]